MRGMSRSGAVLAGTVLIAGRWLIQASLWICTVCSAIQMEKGDTHSEFNRQNWTSEDGLPSNLVHAILQTRDGYIWVATSDGLARFDGVRFTVFNRVNTPQMINHECVSLAEGSDGTLWVGTRDGLLFIQSGVLGRMSQDDGLVDDRIDALCVSRDGSVWVGTRKAISRFVGGRWRSYTQLDGLMGLGFESLHEDQRGTLWAGGTGGVYRFDNGSDKFQRIAGPDLDHHYAQGCAVDLSGNLWAAYSLRDRTEVCLHVKSGDVWSACEIQTTWRQNRKVFLMVDRQGGLWFSKPFADLCRYRNGQVTQFETIASPNGDSASCAYEDREGNLWVGASGLHCLRPSKIRTYNAKNGLLNDNVWTFCERADGSLWIGSDGGLNHFVRGQLSTPDIVPQPMGIRSLAESKSGELWIGTQQATVGVLRGDRIVSFAVGEEGTGHEVRSLAFGPDGTLWIGSGRGLHQFKDDRIVAIYTSENGLPTNDVRAVLFDRGGRMWVGTDGGGLCRLIDSSSGEPRINARSIESSSTSRMGRFVRITKKDGLSNDFVTSLYEDLDGILWVGTGQGLNGLIVPADSLDDGVNAGGGAQGRVESHSLDSPSAEIMVFTRQQGLPDDSIKHVLDDAFGKLWISCDDGIFGVSKKEMMDVAAGRIHSVNCDVFTHFEGALPLRANGLMSEPSGCRTKDGRLWFATTKGAIAINPSQADVSRDPIPVVIERVIENDRIIYDTESLKPGSLRSFKVNGTNNGGAVTVPVVPAESGRSKPSPDIPIIEIPPNRMHVLEFHYTANSFISPENLRFSYRLEGYEDSWHDANSRRVAYYASLRPGFYQLHVRARIQHQDWNETGAVFAFHIQPRFVESGGFAALIAILLVGSVYGTHRWRLSFVRKIETQTALSLERQRMARDLHDDLSADLTRIARLSETALAKELSNSPANDPVRKIALLADQMVTNMRDAVWTTNPDFDPLENLVGYLRENAAHALESTPIQAAFSLPDHIPDRRLTSEFRRHVLLIAKEALQNVVKHSKANRAEIKVSLTDHTFELRIIDDGVGFDPATALVGNGLQNLRFRASQLHGAFEVRSRPGQGTEIRLLIPMQQSKDNLWGAFPGRRT